jgi:hypothetical protein
LGWLEGRRWRANGGTDLGTDWACRVRKNLFVPVTGGRHNDIARSLARPASLGCAKAFSLFAREGAGVEAALATWL